MPCPAKKQKRLNNFCDGCSKSFTYASQGIIFREAQTRGKVGYVVLLPFSSVDGYFIHSSMIRKPETMAEQDKAYDLICQLHHFLSYPVLEKPEYDRRLKFASEGGYEQYLLFDEADIVVGLIGLRVLNDLLRPRRLFIDDLVIDAQHRGKGYSTVLLDFAFDMAKEKCCVRVDLEAALKNDRAIAVYEKKAFEKAAYLMKKFV
ncbi:MAG: GNAT family N-acetyltransferase [Alphaproteobacteria bacterium]|nr:GNAT family N-acetyltransferase [Alphaproteobacteria bacterium]